MNAIPENIRKQLDQRARWNILRGRGGLFCFMGVFMTASEANRQRVFRLLIVEREQMWGQFTTAESPAIKRGKPPMSETRQLWFSNSLSPAVPASSQSLTVVCLSARTSNVT
jgi:hypothetical protein